MPPLPAGLSRFFRPDGDRDRVSGLMVVEFFLRHFLDREPVEEAYCRQNVPECFDSRVRLPEHVAKHAPGRYPCKRPTPVPAPLRVVGLADSGEGREEHTSRLQDSVDGPDRGVEVIDQLERLREDDAIERLRRYVTGRSRGRR